MNLQDIREKAKSLLESLNEPIKMEWEEEQFESELGSFLEELTKVGL